MNDVESILNDYYETYDEDKVHNEEAWRLILLDSFTFLLNLK